MQEVLDALVQGFARPTPEDTARARQEMPLRSKHVSKNPEVFELQTKAWAYSYIAARKSSLLPVYVPPTQEELFTQKLESQRAVSRALVGIGTIYSYIAWDAPETKETAIIKFLRDEYGENKANNALLLGGTGSGKTYGAIAWLSSIASTSNAMFITAYDLCQLILRKKYDALDRVERITWLLLDDLGSEPPGYKGDDFVACFENLFSERHLRQRPTVITCNGTLESVKERYGERFTSRFNETGCVFITPDGDMRNG